MKLIVGLGNPGENYINTRHNVGFKFLDYICKKNNLVFEKEKFNAKYLFTHVDGERVLLIKPLSFMNLSGEVVKKYVNYFKLLPEDILIIQDDLDMEFGKVKIVVNSRSGGHNGIKNIEENLHTKACARLKIGISKDNNIDTRDYVLGKFNEKELKELDEIYESLSNIIEDFCLMSIERLMNKYNIKKR